MRIAILCFIPFFTFSQELVHITSFSTSDSSSFIPYPISLIPVTKQWALSVKGDRPAGNSGLYGGSVDAAVVKGKFFLTAGFNRFGTEFISESGINLGLFHRHPGLPALLGISLNGSGLISSEIGTLNSGIRPICIFRFSEKLNVLSAIAIPLSGRSTSFESPLTIEQAIIYRTSSLVTVALRYLRISRQLDELSGCLALKISSQMTCLTELNLLSGSWRQVLVFGSFPYRVGFDLGSKNSLGFSFSCWFSWSF